MIRLSERWEQEEAALSPMAFRTFVAIAIIGAIQVSVMIVTLRLHPALILLPTLVSGFAFAPSNSTLVRWRDALFILLCATMLLRILAPHSWPREIRWSLGAIGVLSPFFGMVLYAKGDGVGAWMRRALSSGLGQNLRRAFHYLVASFSLLVGGVLYTLLFRGTSIPDELVGFSLLLSLNGMLPTRWRDAIRTVGVGLFLLTLVGAWTGRWSWQTEIVLCIATVSLEFGISTLREGPRVTKACQHSKTILTTN